MLDFTGENRLNSVEGKGEGEERCQVRHCSGHDFTFRESVAYYVAEGEDYESHDD